MSTKSLDSAVSLTVLVIALISLSWVISGMQGSARTQAVEPDIIEDMTTTTTTTTTSSTTEPETIPVTVTSTTSTTSTTRFFVPQCNVNTDCADNGTYVSRDYMCYNGDIYRQYTHYRCQNPGTRKAICVGTEATEYVQKCGLYEHCIDGEAFCEYTEDIDRKEASWRPGGAASLDISNEYERSYKGYRFTIVYVASEYSEPKGVMVDVFKPNGEETWEYVTYGSGTLVGKLNVGLYSMSKKSFEIDAQLWIQEP